MSCNSGPRSSHRAIVAPADSSCEETAVPADRSARPGSVTAPIADQREQEIAMYSRIGSRLAATVVALVVLTLVAPASAAKPGTFRAVGTATFVSQDESG